MRSPPPSWTSATASLLTSTNRPMGGFFHTHLAEGGRRTSGGSAAQLSRTLRYCTGGSFDWSPVLMHVGWPKPPALMPGPPYGLAVISQIMLSGF
jgi:hypothetical protein